MKKLYLLILVLIVLFGIFIFVVISPKNYVLNYAINDIKITEEYQKKMQGYFYTLNYNDIDYPIYINTKYTRKRKHIKSVESYEEKDEVCLVVNVDNQKRFICHKKDLLVDANSVSEKMLNNLGLSIEVPEIKDSYQNINIYNKDNKFIIWDYKGFYLINDSGTDLERLFKKDNYQNNLSYQTDKLLVFPDYDSEYFFTKLYIYNVEKKTIRFITSDFEISYDSYFLGNYKNKLYLIDKKNKFEYEIDLKKDKFKIISEDNTCKIFENNEWENISLTKAINQEIKFSLSSIYNYYLEDNNLFLKINNYSIKVSNQKVKQIVKIDNNKVYYLSQDKLYSYEYLGQEKLLLKYPEWNFNYANHIFIFD